MIIYINLNFILIKLALSEALLSHKNSIFIRSWIECNRGCFALVK
jgi:hypothetical protein